MEVLRSDDPEFFQKFGQVYVSATYPGVVKAWHYHKHQIDNFACITGMVKLVLVDTRDGSPTKDAVNEFFLGRRTRLCYRSPISCTTGGNASAPRYRPSSTCRPSSTATPIRTSTDSRRMAPCPTTGPGAMANVLVTGGAGFIGEQLIAYALDAHPDWHVTTLDKLTYAGRMENLRGLEDNPRHRFVKGDVVDVAARGTARGGSRTTSSISLPRPTLTGRSRMPVISSRRTSSAPSCSWLPRASRLGCAGSCRSRPTRVYGSVPEGASLETDELKPRNPYAATRLAPIVSPTATSRPMRCR